MTSPSMRGTAVGLRGHLTLQSSLITRSVSCRFAVEQLSGKLKLRPIDGLSESLVSASTSRTEAVTPHGIDMVCRALLFRLRHRFVLWAP